jgi:IrrE N-terminal-like domain
VKALLGGFLAPAVLLFLVGQFRPQHDQGEAVLLEEYLFMGHFLMTTHKPPAGGFQCSRADMRRWTDKEKGGVIRMEVEANEFAALILMPPPLWRAELAKFRDPDLAQIVTLAGLFDVSKEAAARAYAQENPWPWWSRKTARSTRSTATSPGFRGWP